MHVAAMVLATPGAAETEADDRGGDATLTSERRSPMAETDDTEPAHPEVVRRRTKLTWPPEKPFPLSQLEAWYVMQGAGR